MKKLLLFFPFLFCCTVLFGQAKVDSVVIDKQVEKINTPQKLRRFNFETGAELTRVIPTAFIGTQIKIVNNLAIEAAIGIFPIPSVFITSMRLGLVNYFMPRRNFSPFINLGLEQIRLIPLRNTPVFPKLMIGFNNNHFNIAIGTGVYRHTFINTYFPPNNTIVFQPSITVAYSNFLFTPKHINK